jgi:hypothetical protein
LNSNNDPATDKRLHFIANMFTNKLSKSENISILKNNENLKNAIYYSLKTKDILRKDKLRITYFSPEEVTHIDRGGSIFDNVLFFAKMYIATLITILMQNIVRGGDKRAYYIEVGLENDISNAVNSAIRDIKAKDIVGLQNYDIQQILQVVGEFNDYYLPTIDGEKPITFDTVSGLSNDSLDNDFLNWLSNNIFSGIGLPSAYLTEAENVDFAKTLAMQNSRHIRDILTDQNLLGIGYSCILRNLFNKKFIDNGTKTTIEKEEKENSTDGYSQLVFNKSNTETINNDKKEKNKKNSKDSEKTNSSNTIYETINLQSIRVLFPSPMSLNMTNLNDQISNFTSFLQPIIETITWNSDEDKTAGSAILTKKYLRKYISAIDWDEFDNMITETKSELNKEKLRKKSLDTTTNSTSSDPSASTDAPPEDSGNAGGEDLGDLGGDF